MWLIQVYNMKSSWSKETPPPGVSYLLCSLIKNREEEDPPPPPLKNHPQNASILAHELELRGGNV